MSSDSLSPSKNTKMAKQKDILPTRSFTWRLARINFYKYPSPTLFAPVQILNTFIAFSTPQAILKQEHITTSFFSTYYLRILFFHPKSVFLQFWSSLQTSLSPVKYDELNLVILPSRADWGILGITERSYVICHLLTRINPTLWV